MGQHSVGIDTAFATKSDTPTHNLGVLVQANAPPYMDNTTLKYNIQSGQILYPIKTNTICQWRQIQYTVTTKTISSYDKFDINFRQIQYPGKSTIYADNTNTIFCYDKSNIPHK